MIKFLLSILFSTFILTSQTWFIYACESLVIEVEKVQESYLSSWINLDENNESSIFDDSNLGHENDIYIRINRNSGRLTWKTFSKQDFVLTFSKNISWEYPNKKNQDFNFWTNDIYIKNTYFSLVWIIKNIN